MGNVRLIGEIGSNHNQDWPRTLALIEKAREIGVWAVKFQLFQADKLYAPDFSSQREKMRQWELPLDFLPKIQETCKRLGLKFICTPFYLDAIPILQPYVDFFKIGSYELLWTDLILQVAGAEKLWFVSCGLDDEDLSALRQAVNITGSRYLNPPMAVFWCNSTYPARPEDCNLKGIRRLVNSNLGAVVGWSDHTTEPGVIYRAIDLGARVIEFHYDLDDMAGVESSVGHCWRPDQIAEVIHNVKIGDSAEMSFASKTDAPKWRTDPADGMRPLKQYREELREK